jgi:hypothetical protein
MDATLARLIAVKIYAAGCTSQAQGIEQIREAWDTTGNLRFARLRVGIQVRIEFAIEIFEEFITLAESILRGPPPYNQNPDERRQRVTEICILSVRAWGYSSGLKNLVEDLLSAVEKVLEMRVEEVYVSVCAMETEAKSMSKWAEKAFSARAQGTGTGAEER